jgi:hypothetical protein
MVVGTNAVPAFALAMGSLIPSGLDATEDFDLAWISGLHLSVTQNRKDSLWEILRRVDSTYTVNTERSFQARNAKAYEVELLVAPSQIASLTPGDKPCPIPMPELEWLLLGQTVSSVVCGLDGSPARIVAPDPRFFGLQKIWLSEQPERHNLKRDKDRRQGEFILAATHHLMPSHPLDGDFIDSVPDVLKPILIQQLSLLNQGCAKPAEVGPSW